MKVFIDYKLNESGKSKFLKRLIPALKKIGVECRFKQKGCDVALGISWWHTKTKLPKVLRVDGIYLNSGKKEKYRNGKVRTAIKKADHVIYQSKFAKKTVNKRLKVNPKCSVIYNGADPEYYDSAVCYDNPHETNYLMCARWGNRKHKRLKDHIRYAENHPDIHFYLAGETDRRTPENVTKLGWVRDIELRRYQKTCSHLVYLADTDWCPSGVIEAILAGCEVIYNPKCKAVKELCGLPVEKLYIDNVAKQYKKVLRGCI
jgi:glycosyltransferase involved in cell wall biosynthesis